MKPMLSDEQAIALLDAAADERGEARLAGVGVRYASSDYPGAVMFSVGFPSSWVYRDVDGTFYTPDEMYEAWVGEELS